jgi:hypothetical protein
MKGLGKSKVLHLREVMRARDGFEHFASVLEVLGKVLYAGVEDLPKGVFPQVLGGDDAHFPSEPVAGGGQPQTPQFRYRVRVVFGLLHKLREGGGVPPESRQHLPHKQPLPLCKVQD